MTSELKCPFCGKKLVQDRERSILSIIYRCPDDKCFLKYGCAESDIWQALIRRTNQLNIAITDIHHAYKSLMGGCAEWRLYLKQTLKQIQDLDNDK